MPRQKRNYIDEQSGGYHVISRIVGQQYLLGGEEKDKFVKILLELCQIYFIDLHSFCVMDNHFHVLVTMLRDKARKATSSEIQRRMILLSNRYRNCGREASIHIENSRSRLGSLSRFVQDLKQDFSRWYNRKHGRKGYLWADRFKSILISHGKAQLACSAYIDLNPKRAGMVELANQYKWSSQGLLFYDPEKAEKVLNPLQICGNEPVPLQWYSDYISTCIEELDLDKDGIIVRFCDFGAMDFHSRNPNFSEGNIVGSCEFVRDYQKLNKLVSSKVYYVSGSRDLATTRVFKC
jgi:REP element-mobilizing transposase RayT